MYKLDPASHPGVRHLFSPWAYHVGPEAVISGTSPGEIYVDNTAAPQTALLANLEHYFLVGRDDNVNFNLALKQFLREIIRQKRQPFPANQAGLHVTVHPETWTTFLDEVYEGAGRFRIVDRRRYYSIDAILPDWRNQIPNGYSLHQIDRKLLARFGAALIERIDWLGRWYGDLNAFVEKAYGYCALHGDQLVCDCPAFLTGPDRCELAIGTDEAHRRKGVATITAAATVEHLLNRGFRSVRWGCTEHNEASWRTAERVGFRLIGQHEEHYCMFDEAKHWAEAGWIAFHEARYQETMDYYERSFAINPKANREVFQHVASAAAQLGHEAKANYYRQRATEVTLPDAIDIGGNVA